MAILSCAHAENGYVVHIDGAATMKHSPAFRAFVHRCLEGDRQAIVTVDLTDCDYLDSTFLGCFVGLHKLGGEGNDGRLRFFAAPNQCQRLFAHSLLDRVLNIVDHCPLLAGDFADIPSCELDALAFGNHIMQCHRRLAAVGGKDAAAFSSVAEQLARELGR